MASARKHLVRRRAGERLPQPEWGQWGRRRAVYLPRRASDTALYRVVQYHLETFLTQAAEVEGEGTPPWVEWSASKRSCSAASCDTSLAVACSTKPTRTDMLDWPRSHASTRSRAVPRAVPHLPRPRAGSSTGSPSRTSRDAPRCCFRRSSCSSASRNSSRPRACTATAITGCSRRTPGSGPGSSLSVGPISQPRRRRPERPQATDMAGEAGTGKSPPMACSRSWLQ